MIIDELAYKITVRADEFLNGKRQVEEGANAMRNNLRRTANETSTSVNALTGSFNRFGDAGKQAFSGVQLGAAKFLGVALTLEGARRTFLSTTSSLVQLGNMSGFLGMSARSLDGFTRAANAAGSSGASVTNSLMRIKNAQLWSRTGMGAPDESTVAIQQLQGMTGVDIIGAQNPGQGLTRQAEALRKLNRDQAQVMWQRMGGGDDMFNLMYSGNLASLQKDFESRSNATPAAIKQAQDVTKTLEELKATAESVSQQFLQTFGKDINDALKEFGDWVANNKGNILGFFQDGAKWAKDFADALNGSSNALHSFFQITENFNLLSGFKNPILDVPGISKRAGDISVNKNDVLSVNPNDPFGALPKQNNPFGENDYQAPKGTSFFGWLSTLLAPEAGAASVTPTLRRSSPSPLNGQVGSSLLDALMMTESGGNPLAYNARSGAAGAYQFMPGTARDLGLQVGGGVDERLDPEKSRAAASAYLSQLIRRYKGNVDSALKAYNWGMGNVDSWIKTGRGVNGQEIPLETQQYSGKVARYYQQMTNTALTPGGSGYTSVDKTQTHETRIDKVYVNSNPTSVDQLTQSINQQAQRSHVTVSFAGGVNPS